MKIYVDELPSQPARDCLFFNPQLDYTKNLSCILSGCHCGVNCPLVPISHASANPDPHAAPDTKEVPKKEKVVSLYTDGSCLRNPGPGGWSAILIVDGVEQEISGGEPQTTNNRMELMAVIMGLSLIKEPCTVELWSDSQYVINGLEKGWAKNWKRHGWVKSDKTPALNPDLWEVLLNLTDKHHMNYHWIKGHADNEYNNRCDKLAVAQSRKMSEGS